MGEFKLLPDDRNNPRRLHSVTAALIYGLSPPSI